MANHCLKTCGLCTLLEGARAVKKKEKTTRLPNANDLKGILSGMASLQMAYNIPIALMRKGIIHDFHTSVKLSAWDCLQIAYQVYEEGILSYTLLWFEEILRAFNDTEILTYVHKKRSDIAEKHDKFWTKDENHFPNLLSKYPHQNPVPSDFHQYCMKSREKMPVKAEEGLQCHLATKGNPFFLLQPLKQETLRTDPEMLLFHDVISDSEIETLKWLAMSSLKRDEMDSRRTEHIALQNVTHSVIDDIERRAEMFSGLLSHSKVRNPDEIDPEPLKVRSYGACGDFGVHTDTYYIHNGNSSTNITDPRPERLATVIFYLNDVLEGGSTVFLECGVVVTPKKGSALLFHNVKKNGDFENRSIHGSCPLTVGNKWVAVKWFSDKYNFLTRQCSTNPFE
ncbi:prolyl 4-hydroxylase subunit alpha-2-like [Macrobrachium rosenbergii]|uniref:prolyl 4-hydroxylase subunit alpha-2-like n=1 Tax=Macrobrachium rosenbergii TaxID=79674 RepID=UPI0034D45FC2